MKDFLRDAARAARTIAIGLLAGMTAYTVWTLFT